MCHSGWTTSTRFDSTCPKQCTSRSNVVRAPAVGQPLNLAPLYSLAGIDHWHVGCYIVYLFGPCYGESTSSFRFLFLFCCFQVSNWTFSDLAWEQCQLHTPCLLTAPATGTLTYVNEMRNISTIFINGSGAGAVPAVLMGLDATWGPTISIISRFLGWILYITHATSIYGLMAQTYQHSKFD